MEQAWDSGTAVHEKRKSGDVWALFGPELPLCLAHLVMITYLFLILSTAHHGMALLEGKNLDLWGDLNSS